MESKFGMLAVAKKLVKDEVQLWWQNFEKINKNLLTRGCPNKK
jgi:hypothetical protein